MLSLLRYQQGFWFGLTCSFTSKTIHNQSRPSHYTMDPNYLSFREQYVVVNGTQSLTLPVVFGVPQGSVLGLLLFLICINDITCVISDGKISLYAYDIVLYQIIRSPIDYILVQQDVDSICAWVNQNLLVLNTWNVVIYCSQRILLHPFLHHPCLSMTPSCTCINNLNTLVPRGHLLWCNLVCTHQHCLPES